MKFPLEVSSYVDAPVDRVEAALASEWILTSWLAETVDPATVHVQRAPGKISVEGDWWYRGELTASPEGSGSRLILRVSNIAKRARWAVPLVNGFFKGFVEQQQQTVTELARMIAQGRHD
jgi:hypothetical protein